MKNYLNTLLFMVCAFTAIAQTPQKFNYQAVARNAQGAILPNQNVKIRASILDGSANGMSQYTETHSVTTSQLGLFNLAIGLSLIHISVPAPAGHFGGGGHCAARCFWKIRGHSRRGFLWTKNQVLADLCDDWH